MKSNTHYLEINKNSVSIRNDETDSFIKCVDISNSSSAKPFVKWAGGKRWLANAATKLKPKKWSGKYYEPFLGGGSFFFALAPNKAIISDINIELITTYEVIRDSHKKLINILKEYPYDNDFYYSIRNKEPKEKIEIAARFIYLNRACWNGLYRVNLKGKFNTPFGKYVNPKICNEEVIEIASKALKKTKIKKNNFAETVSDAKRNDWIYFDPPYITGHQNNGFLKYNQSLFSWNDQVSLASCARKLAALGVNVLVSNADYPDVINLYKDFYYYKTTRLSVIGSLVETRGLVSEAILSSYPLFEIKSRIIK